MQQMTKRTIILLLMISIISAFTHCPFAQASPKSFVIHEIKPGDTLWSIGKRYGQPIQTIKRLNGLTLDQLVPGQPLLIPGNTYMVTAGESLWDIAIRHAVPVWQLAQENKIKDPQNISPGTKIKIPQIPHRSIMTGGYIVPRGREADLATVDRYQSLVTQVGVFEYHPDWNGNLSSLYADHIIKKTWIKHSIPFAVVTNLSEKGFDRDLAHHLLTNPAKRKQLIQNIGRVLREHDYKGVNIDFEGVAPADQQAFSQFMEELAKKLKPSGFLISVAVPPKQADHYPQYNDAYDYKKLGQIADSIFIMTYDWHWLGGAPGPIAPIQQVRSTLDYAVKAIPKNKIYLGIAMYAYDWTHLKGGKFEGRAYAQQNAINKAATLGSPIHYDFASRSPYFFYTENGQIHEVWFEDARSIWSKYRLVTEYGIAGMGGWQLGLSFPQAERLLQARFNIQKP